MWVFILVRIVESFYIGIRYDFMGDFIVDSCNVCGILVDLGMNYFIWYG